MRAARYLAANVSNDEADVLGKVNLKIFDEIDDFAMREAEQKCNFLISGGEDRMGLWCGRLCSGLP